ncbi:IS3 family transposase [Nocardioides houyundeii]|uniref:IS3 family transposase n=1 Tax=Nocardioides houyundeii TaxID=2045452 RepID=UPI000DF23BA7
MPIAPSSYCAAKTRPPSARAVADEQRLAVIRQVHADNYGVYGVGKMHAELSRRGHRIARCTVHRLMRTDGLRGISRAKGPRTTVPWSGPGSRPDLLDRDFKAPAPNRNPLGGSVAFGYRQKPDTVRSARDQRYAKSR